MKRTVALILLIVLMLSLVPAAFAASDEAVSAANALHELGLFNGTGVGADGKPNFDLDRTPTRNEAVTMLVRLLGKEDEAKAGIWKTPFTDVPQWAMPYVGYAYEHGLTTGMSATLYSGNKPVTVSQYLTFVLRSLGYTSGADFQWDKAWVLSDQIGLTQGQYNANTTNFTRGDVAIISNSSLSIKEKTASVPPTTIQPEAIFDVDDITLETVYVLLSKRSALNSISLNIMANKTFYYPITMDDELRFGSYTFKLTSGTNPIKTIVPETKGAGSYLYEYRQPVPDADYLKEYGSGYVYFTAGEQRFKISFFKQGKDRDDFTYSVTKLQ